MSTTTQGGALAAGTRGDRRGEARGSGARATLLGAGAGLALFGLAAGPALAADVPRVTSDIPPVHSLVSSVMGELGRPRLLTPPGASPHGYALRPSEAATLEASDVVFWTSEALTPWLAREIDALAPDAVSVELMALDGTRRLAVRHEATFAAAASDGPDDGVDPDEHADLDGHPDDATTDEGGGHEHGDAAHDPHGWLDPRNARSWLDAIADTLSRLDPDNAAVYAANAAATRAELEALVRRVDERLAAVRERPFVVFHDSFQYFEERFGLRAAGALSPSDASAASPARLQRVRDGVRRLDVGCVFVGSSRHANPPAVSQFVRSARETESSGRTIVTSPAAAR